ncbi:hypothetical protein B0H19DRAFT_143567 [Mycena capillaripes]|nr:hypothetical protein B0H19DRAFT_143567 [Mycena capillaripes]
MWTGEYLASTSLLSPCPHADESTANKHSGAYRGGSGRYSQPVLAADSKQVSVSPAPASCFVLRSKLVQTMPRRRTAQRTFKSLISPTTFFQPNPLISAASAFIVQMFWCLFHSSLKTVLRVYKIPRTPLRNNPMNTPPVNSATRQQTPPTDTVNGNGSECDNDSRSPPPPAQSGRPRRDRLPVKSKQSANSKRR